jgi:hypothetical protein
MDFSPGVRASAIVKSGESKEFQLVSGWSGEGRELRFKAVNGVILAANERLFTMMSVLSVTRYLPVVILLTSTHLVYGQSMVGAACSVVCFPLADRRWGNRQTRIGPACSAACFPFPDRRWGTARSRTHVVCHSATKPFNSLVRGSQRWQNIYCRDTRSPKSTPFQGVLFRGITAQSFILHDPFQAVFVALLALRLTPNRILPLFDVRLQPRPFCQGMYTLILKRNGLLWRRGVKGRGVGNQRREGTEAHLWDGLCGTVCFQSVASSRNGWTWEPGLPPG